MIFDFSTETFFHDLFQVTLPQPHTNTADNQNYRKADDISVHAWNVLGSAQIIALPKALPQNSERAPLIHTGL